MLRTSILLFTLLCNAFAAQAESNPDSLLLRSIYDEALTNGESYENLRTLTKDIGHRLSGSQSAADAMQWGSAVMRGYGADSVWIMPVMVPSWTRGSLARSLTTIFPFKCKRIYSGSSVQTTAGGSQWFRIIKIRLKNCFS